MITIYLHGCSCGVNGYFVRRAQAYARKMNNVSVEVKNTMYDKDALERHLWAIEFLKIKKDTLAPVVIETDDLEEGGQTVQVSLLKEWGK